MAKGTIDDVLRKLESIDRWRVVWEEEKKKHAKTLYGNGDPGVDEMLRGVYAYINEQKALTIKRSAWWERFQWVLIPIAVGGIGSFIYQAFVFYFQVWPVISSLKP